MVGILRRGESLQLQRETALAVQINGIARIKVDAPCIELRLPAGSLDLGGEQGIRLFGIVITKPEDSVSVAICDGNNSGLVRLKINLESQFVGFVVAIEVIHLRRQLGGLQGSGVFRQRGCIAGGNDQRTSLPIATNLAQLRQRYDDVLRRSVP